MEKENLNAKIVILCGVDRSGKDSAQNAIDKYTKYKHIVIDRGPVGFMTYCEIFDKDAKLFEQYQKMETWFATNPNVIILYIEASTEELIRRCKETDHEILDFDYHKKIYRKYIEKTPLPVIKVDTTERHIDDIVKDLIEKGVL